MQDLGRKKLLKLYNISGLHGNHCSRLASYRTEREKERGGTFKCNFFMRVLKLSRW
jgi:hypothetical protein